MQVLLNPRDVVLIIFMLVCALICCCIRIYKLSATNSKLSATNSKISGSRWLYLADFHSKKISRQQPASAYSTLASKSNTVFPLFCPKERGLIPANTEVRCQQKVQSAVISSGPFQRAHLMPFSDKCNRTYRPLFEPMIKPSSPYSQERMLDFLFYGFRKNINDDRVAYSGLVHNWFNILGLEHQYEGLDLKSLIAFIPLTIDGKPVTISDILEWKGQEMSALILPHSVEDGQKYFRFTGELEELVSEIESNDPLVYNAVDVVNQFYRMVNAYLAHYDVDEHCEGTNKLVFCQLYREFSRDVNREIPCLEIPPCTNKFLKVQAFPARRIMSPRLGRRKRSASSTNSIGPGESLSDFSAPHPFFLLLRAINSWLDYLHANNMWIEWSSYVENSMAKDSRLQVKKRKKSMGKARLVLLPSCCDVSMYEPDCIVCKTELLIRRPEVFPGLTDHLLDLANMFVFTQATLTEEQYRQILMLRADPGLCYKRDAGRRRTSSLSSAETQSPQKEKAKTTLSSGQVYQLDSAS